MGGGEEGKEKQQLRSREELRWQENRQRGKESPRRIEPAIQT